MTHGPSYSQVRLPARPLAGYWLCSCAALPVSRVGPFGMNVAQVCGTIAGLETSS